MKARIHDAQINRYDYVPKGLIYKRDDRFHLWVQFAASRMSGVGIPICRDLELEIQTSVLEMDFFFDFLTHLRKWVMSKSGF